MFNSVSHVAEEVLKYPTNFMPVVPHHVSLILLAMLPFIAWSRQFRWAEARHIRRVLSLLAALGMLGFVFSALSPDDDSVQQEFARSQSSSQSIAKEDRSHHQGIVAQPCVSAAGIVTTSPRCLGRTPSFPVASFDFPPVHPSGDRSPPQLFA